MNTSQSILAIINSSLDLIQTQNLAPYCSYSSTQCCHTEDLTKFAQR